MYQNRPSKSHQLPFDQGVQIHICITQVQCFMYQNRLERYLTVFCINRTTNVCYDFIRMVHNFPSRIQLLHVPKNGIFCNSLIQVNLKDEILLKSKIYCTYIFFQVYDMPYLVLEILLMNTLMRWVNLLTRKWRKWEANEFIILVRYVI